jgi:alpha-beta hydrolase superfamily lysophospholipase
VAEPVGTVNAVGPDLTPGTLGGGDALRRFTRASDGVDLHYLTWSGKEPWAALAFLHGIASHGGWFSETAADLAAEGVAVYAPDRRGSGRSGGPRGHLDTYDRALDDLDQILRLVASERPGVPVFVAASSWAAKLAVVHAAQRPGGLVGLLLLGPGLLARVTLSPPQLAAVVVGHLIRPAARVPIPLTPELYTANPPYVELIRADPLRLLDATTRFFWETARLDRLRGRASAGLRLPLLLLQGEADAMMDVPKTRDWFDGLDTEDKTYRSYPGAGHTLDFEPDRSRYLADLLNWLSARVQPRSPHTAR